MGLTSCPRYFVRVPNGQTGNKSRYRECQITDEMTCNNYWTVMTNEILRIYFDIQSLIQHSQHQVWWPYGCICITEPPRQLLFHHALVYMTSNSCDAHENNYIENQRPMNMKGIQMEVVYH